MQTNDQMQGRGKVKGFTNAFSSNLNTVNLKMFPCHGQSIELLRDFCLIYLLRKCLTKTRVCTRRILSDYILFEFYVKRVYMLYEVP